METQGTSINKTKKAFWQQQISNWQSSGLSQKEFCRRQSIALSTFTYWKRKNKFPTSETTKFYPLVIPEPCEMLTDSGLRLLVGKKKFRIEIEESFSVNTLKKLISVLEQL